uniref:NADH dehydrogenase subunit 6 n=1 Tax=Photinus signaticollis TaxID=3018954 RepID=UPI0023AB03D5|nr:NADH dehydrogenase subunit 6 [Photinus signaticollis]WCD24465.1 NADH dehydrogenase subunit 6 [Photinus signaticollis]
MEIMILFLILSTTTFIFMKHPMSMGLILLIQTTLISLTTSIFSLNSWFSYILFLTMVGGMLILFTYMNSIASNEMFKYNNSLTMTLMILTFIMLIFMNYDSLINNIKNFNIDSSMFNMNAEFTLSLTKYLTIPLTLTWLMMIIYLLVTLIAVVKISMIKYGPLQQNY